jgi:large subunit ribosomal protein L20
MARVKGSNIHKNRRKKILKLARGYFGSKHKLYKTAKEQVMHSLKYAYRDRRQNKREMRKLWITRINAACRMNEISYSKFISGLNKAGIEINRKMLSEVAIDDAKTFTSLVNIAKDALSGKTIKQEVKASTDKKEKAPQSGAFLFKRFVNFLQISTKSKRKSSLSGAFFIPFQIRFQLQGGSCVHHKL